MLTVSLWESEQAMELLRRRHIGFRVFAEELCGCRQ